jgi:hypothetical protein
MDAKSIKKFKMEHRIFKSVEFFHENDAPTWLTSENSIPGSTMDERWFWENHVLKLNVGQSILTDFRKITRMV